MAEWKQIDPGSINIVYNGDGTEPTGYAYHDRVREHWFFKEGVFAAPKPYGSSIRVVGARPEGVLGFEKFNLEDVKARVRSKFGTNVVYQVLSIQTVPFS